MDALNLDDKVLELLTVEAVPLMYEQQLEVFQKHKVYKTADEPMPPDFLSPKYTLNSTERTKTCTN